MLYLNVKPIYNCVIGPVNKKYQIYCILYQICRHQEVAININSIVRDVRCLQQGCCRLGDEVVTVDICVGVLVSVSEPLHLYLWTD